MKKQTLFITLILAAFIASVGTAYAVLADSSDLAAAREATARYQRLDVALADGYQLLFDCTVNPSDASQGAMGQHYIKPDLAGDAVLDPEQPEVLMYEPRPDGSMKLVSVEYVIFADNWTGSQAPEFLGQTMKLKNAVGTHEVPEFYEVHAWLWRHNPAGIFADWNTEVSCP